MTFDPTKPCIEPNNKPFRVTGPGWYRMRTREEIRVFKSEKDDDFHWQSELGAFRWRDDGTDQDSSIYDLVAFVRPLDEPSGNPGELKPASAGLKGFIAIWKDGNKTSSLIWSNVENPLPGWKSIIDLSTLTEANLVKPEAKPVTKKIKIGIWEDDHIETIKPLGWTWTIEPIAIKEIEVTYTPGEGIEK